MWTVVGFNENNSAAAAYVNLAGIADQTTRVIDDIVYVPDRYTRLVGVIAAGYDVVRAKLESPSLREMGVLMIEPKANYDYAAFKQYPVGRYSPEGALELAAGEGLEGFVYCGRTADTFIGILVMLADAPITPVTGRIFTCRATYESITPVESKWINQSITFEETLPVGRYQIVGASMWHQSGLFFRFVFIGEPNRPGGIVGSGEGSIEPEMQRLGKMGVWGEFHSSTPPTVDLVAMDTNASSGSMELDLIRVG